MYFELDNNDMESSKRRSIIMIETIFNEHNTGKVNTMFNKGGPHFCLKK